MDLLWLEQKRKNMKLQQWKIAQKCDISQQAYSLIEKGKRYPSVKLAKKIASILNFEWTLFFENNKNGN